MLCRLCLTDLQEPIDIILTLGKSNNYDVALLIKKYLGLELRPSDPVSTRICRKCWLNLKDFHEFYRQIRDKQRALLYKIEATKWIEACQVPVVQVQVPKAPEEATQELNDSSTHVEDLTQCEPIIDVTTLDYESDDESIDEIDVEASDNASDEFAPNTKRNEQESLKAKKATTSTKKQRPTRAQMYANPPSEEARAEFERRKLVSHELDKFIDEHAKLVCDLCEAPLKDFNELKRHYRVEHGCVGYAKCCNNLYRKRSLYVEHLSWHKDPECFKCFECDRRYVSRNCLRLHNLRYHTEEKAHQCHLCPIRFAKGYLLKQHLRVHFANRERTEKCPSCDKAFRSTQELQAHVDRMHDELNAPIICDFCGASFRTKQDFLVHKRSVHREGPQLPEVQCTICWRWLRDENSLRKHMHFHREPDEADAHKCDHCDVVLPSRRKLVFHMRYHHSNRYKCTLCAKEFKKSVTLAEHMATHTGVDLYQCSFCDRTFKSHGNMHKHKRRMHPDQWVRKDTVPSQPAAETETVSRPEEAQDAATVAIDLKEKPEKM